MDNGQANAIQCNRSFGDQIFEQLVIIRLDLKHNCILITCYTANHSSTIYMTLYDMSAKTTT
ncbi:hypothetical protein D3C76_1827470 [compost metagenome]